MKTKNRNTLPATPISKATESHPAATESAAPIDSTKLKIAVPLNEDGSFDMETMRDKTKERLKKAINATPGLAPAPTASSPMLFPPMVVISLYRSISSLEIMLAGRIGNIPQPIADKVFTFTEAELVALTPPTQRVLQKYAAEWMIKYQDEITLATLLTTMTIAKVNAAIMLAKQSQPKVVEIPQKEPEAPNPQVQ